MSRSTQPMRRIALRWVRRTWEIAGWIVFASILYWALGWIFWPPY